MTSATRVLCICSLPDLGEQLRHALQTSVLPVSTGEDLRLLADRPDPVKFDVIVLGSHFRPFAGVQPVPMSPQLLGIIRRYYPNTPLVAFNDDVVLLDTLSSADPASRTSGSNHLSAVTQLISEQLMAPSQ